MWAALEIFSRRGQLAHRPKLLKDQREIACKDVARFCMK